MTSPLIRAEFPELPGFQSNKVRDCYQLPDRKRLLISTDRQSAFDQILAAVPYKGQVLNQLARYWFEATKDLCPNHVISYPDPNVILAKDLDMLPIEIVVRGYMTGSTNTSIWTMYNQGQREMYGHRFPDGMVKNQQLDTAIITATTKPTDGGHDEPITEAQVLETGLLSEAHWQDVSAKALALFARGQSLAAEKGLILVDTKYEFGLDQDGIVTVADEIHTPDSSRYWIANSLKQRLSEGLEPESLDKEFLRLWVSSRCDPYKDPIPEIPQETLLEFSNKYIAVYERMTGLAFEKSDPSIAPADRIRAALAKALPEYWQSA